MPAGPPRFRPRCSCGWVGDAVDASMLVVAFEAHLEELTQVPPEQPGTGEGR